MATNIPLRYLLSASSGEPAGCAFHGRRSVPTSFRRDPWQSLYTRSGGSCVSGVSAAFHSTQGGSCGGAQHISLMSFLISESEYRDTDGASHAVSTRDQSAGWDGNFVGLNKPMPVYHGPSSHPSGTNVFASLKARRISSERKGPAAILSAVHPSSTSQNSPSRPLRTTT